MIIAPSILLVLLSIAVIFTSSEALAIQQAVFAVVGIFLFFLLSNFDIRVAKTFIKPLYFLILFLLVLVLLVGIETRGSIRWIPLGPFNFQPSEFAKIAEILALSFFWSSNLPTFKNIFKSLLIFIPFFLLVFFQPDLGTALTLSFIWISMLFASNISLIKIILVSILGVLLAPASWFFLRDYQKERLLSFLSPAKDPLGGGYNVIQSTIAVGSGQILGRGLGRGTQSRLQFLPEFRTDFIFAFIAEELGFLGSFIVLVLYGVIFFISFRVLLKTSDRLGELIIIGVISMLFFQIIVNIGMNTGIFPITGITLPLLSYGGSSVVVTFSSLGLIASVDRFCKKHKFDI